MNATPAYIFVVDAEAAEGERLQGLLASHGHRTAGFVDAAEAVESIPREPPDLILLDERVAAGAARITRLLKSDPDTCDIPIIMLSARGDRGARLESLEAGAEEFLAKPVDRDELGLRVRNLLRLKAAGDLAKGHRTELADEMLARSAELRRFRAAMDFTDDIVTLVSRATMRYTEANAAACRLLGRTRAELLALGPEHLGFDSRGTLEAIYDRIIRGELVQPQELEFVRADGSIVHLEVNRHALRADGGWSIVAVARDITERRRTEEKLRQLAHYDALTGLPNRRMFHECLSRAMEQADALRQQVVLMYLDLNDFKNVNDSLGHAGGDALLREVGHRLHGALYPRDSVGRLGGDEFGIVLVTPRNPHIAMTVARRIQEALVRPFELDGHAVGIGASIGITLYPADGADPVELARNADLAMYDAKGSGRNESRFYTAAMNDRLREKLALDKALRLALERGEFELHYQPIVSLRSGQWRGAEALLRWNRPGHGLVGPAGFITALEDSGLIVPVGAWVVTEACRQMTAWQREGIGPISVAVNVSAFQIARLGGLLDDSGTSASGARAGTTLIEAAACCMQEHGIAAGMLEMEITESAVMADAEHNVAVLGRLKALGVRLAVDDFGTGYSSLAYLRRFPLDAVKIDGSFIREVTTSAEDASITLAIIEMAHRLNLKVVAECVETRAQAEFLRANGCDEAQGYFIARPMTAPEFAAKWAETAGIAPGVADRFLCGAQAGVGTAFPGMPVPWRESEGFERALLAGDRDGCRSIIAVRIAQGHALVEVQMHVVQPALYRIGQKWFLNEISVAQEHLATGTASVVMTEMMFQAPRLAANGHRILLACVEGNHHALGLQMVADAFLLEGWDVNLLGANVPSESIVRQAAEWRPHVLALSLSLPQHLISLDDVVSRLRDAPGPEMPRLLVGGLALAGSEGMPLRPGLDAWAGDSAAALRAATAMVAASAPRETPAR